MYHLSILYLVIRFPEILLAIRPLTRSLSSLGTSIQAEQSLGVIPYLKDFLKNFKPNSSIKKTKEMAVSKRGLEIRNASSLNKGIQTLDSKLQAFLNLRIILFANRLWRKFTFKLKVLTTQNSTMRNPRG